MSPLDLFGKNRNLAISSKAIPNLVEGAQTLEVVKIEGRSSMETSDFAYTIQLRTSPLLAQIPAQELLSYFDLGAFIGKEATVYIALDTSITATMDTPREITGIISSAQFKRVAERGLMFEIQIVDWLSLGKLNTDHVIFQNQTPIQTITQTLNDTFPYSFELRTHNSYPERDFCVRMGEDATRFVKRLCSEFGVNLHYEFMGGSAKLILSDNNAAFAAFPVAAYQTQLYHPDPHSIDEQHWYSFSPSRTLTTGAVTYRDHDYLSPDASNEAARNEPIIKRDGSAVNHGSYEQFHYHSDAFSNTVQPDAGNSGHGDPIAEGQVFTLQHLQSLQMYSDRATASGTIRAAEVGRTFKLTGHPMAASNIEYIIVESRLLVEEIAGETQRNTEDAQKWHVETHATLQPSTLALRPSRTYPKPRFHGIDVARVVGHEGETALWTDPNARIKVLFPWSRTSPTNQDASCWIRVSSNYAGNQQGSIHLPRIDDEILVSYLGGDPDLPVCTGQVYNATHMPPWVLPKNQALSGYRSRELKPGNQAEGRSNHLILDDSEGAISVSLQSDADFSMLNLGEVTRIEGNEGRKEARTDGGAEFRTDGKMAIRAAKGMLVTTQGRAGAASHITDLNEAAAELKQAHSQHKATGQAAAEHKAYDEAEDAKELAETIQTQNDGIKPKDSTDKFPEFTAPHLVIHSVAGLETSTPQSTHINSGENLALTSGDNISLSVGKRLLTSAMQGIRLFSQSMGIKIFAASGKVEIQAQSDDMDIIADKVLKIISAKSRIEIAAAEEILLTAKGSYIKINGNGIEHGTPAGWTAYAASHALPGPKSITYKLPEAPVDEMFIVKNDKGAPIADFAYKIVDSDGKEYRGVTNEKGETMRIGGYKATQLKLFIDND